MATGLHDHESIDTAYEAGATDFIVKPVEWETAPADPLSAAPRLALLEPARRRRRRVIERGQTTRRGKATSRPAEAPQLATIRASALANAADGSTILIVDDDPVVRSLTRDALEDDGYDVVEAEDGVAACEACEEAVPA